MENKTQQLHYGHRGYTKSLEQVLEDPLVRFAVENLGAQVFPGFPDLAHFDAKTRDDSAESRVSESRVDR